MATIETQFNFLIFEGSDNFAIFATDAGVSAKGKVFEPPTSLLNTKIVLHGEYDVYKGKKTFLFSSYEIQENQMFFFLTKMVKGIPASAARQMVKDHSEDELSTIITETPERLLNYKGIGKKKLERIKEKWIEFGEVRALGKYLLPFGVTNNLIVRIHEHFGAHAVKVVSQNTYRLIEVHGVGFKKADEVALKIGVDPKDHRRLAACIMYCLAEKMAGQGNSVIDIATLAKVVNEELLVDGVNDVAHDYQSIVREITQLVTAGEIAVAKGNLPEPSAYITLPYLMHFETAILDALDASNKKNIKPLIADIDRWISAYEKKCNWGFGEQQKEAIKMANVSSSIIAISGYAGTGKTTTSKAILTLFAEAFSSEIGCCALSGIAANRVKNQSGYPGFTIHSLLGYKNGEWTYNHKNKLPYKVILADESSMPDIEMFYRLVSAIDFKNGARLILLGDPAQLEPVGPGAPYTDTLRYKLIPSVTLDKIYRQSEDKVITLFAAAVRQHQAPTGYKGGVFDDFRFVSREIPNYHKLKRALPKSQLQELREKNNLSIREAILDEAYAHRDEINSFYIAKDLKRYITEFQVLSPMKKGAVGVKELNTELQAILNPDMGQASIEVGERAIRVRDKVVHLRNKDMRCVEMANYRAFIDGKSETENRRVFNGQLGAVIKIDAEEEEVHVCYPNEGIVVVYSTTDISNWVLDHAFCLSIHKSQGSEFTHVVVPMTYSHYNMLSPRLIYTAMTRAKESLALVGESDAFEAGCRKKENAERKTLIGLICADREAANAAQFAQTA